MKSLFIDPFKQVPFVAVVSYYVIAVLDFLLIQLEKRVDVMQIRSVFLLCSIIG